MTSLWEFLTESNIHLRRIGTYDAFRTHDDSYIIQSTFESNSWTDKEKQDFNICRLYLGVELLSDIVTANGTHIRRNIMQGVRENTNTGPTITTTTTPNPDAAAWKTWKK